VDTDTTDFREFRVLDSQYLRKDEIWKDFNVELADFTEVIYNELKPIVLEQDIMTLQSSIADGELSYEALTKFYMYRIRKFDRENDLSLNSVISLNPYVLQEARERDKAIKKKENRHLIYGMPILLKDNVNVANMPTTAGAAAFHNNYADDAFITTQLRKKGALILGKSNLSEWAYFFCGDCPSGYSAIGGQTLNPYGRRTMGTGGSSSGSGASIAANFAVGAIGSETSGSILSPSSANSIVGLKPTVGLLSRSGIVPISSTLDTPGPMTRNVLDNAIIMDALSGYDESDSKAINHYESYVELDEGNINGRRLGAFKRLLSDSTYVQAIKALKRLGVDVVEVDEEEFERNGFRRILNLDMKKDLPIYISEFANDSVSVRSVYDVIDFNTKDSINRAPYGQRLFRGIVADTG
jgi:amidase